MKRLTHDSDGKTILEYFRVKYSEIRPQLIDPISVHFLNIDLSYSSVASCSITVKNVL